MYNVCYITHISLQSARSVWRQSTILPVHSFGFFVAICTERVEAKGNETAFATFLSGCNLHGACGGKVRCRQHPMNPLWLQSARSVWRQSARHPRLSRHTRRCNLHGACGGKGRPSSRNRDYLSLQSARSVWRQRSPAGGVGVLCSCCNLHGACGGKAVVRRSFSCPFRLQSARSVWRQSSVSVTLAAYSRALQSARSVWRQSSSKFTKVRQGANVAICTERVEAKVRRFAYAHLCRVAICTERVEAKCGFKRPQRRLTCCNLHGACGGKVANPS